MSGDQLDLDAIEAWAQAPIATFRKRQEFVERTRVEVVPALVAEVRRLRARVEELEDDNPAGPHEDLSIPNPFGDDPPPIVVA